MTTENRWVWDAMTVVQDGSDVLDRVLPEWAERIDPDTLDLESTGACVLGQLYGDYHHGLNLLGLSMEDAIMLGFLEPNGRYVDEIPYPCVDDEAPNTNCDCATCVLEAWWRVQIEWRQ